MNRIPRLTIVALAVFGCVAFTLFQPVQLALTTQSQVVHASNQANATQSVSFEKHFRELGVNGSILIYDLNRNRTYQHNSQRNETPFLPASTFKIPNSLIALETGVIPHELSVLTWDGIERAVPSWNRDLNMKEAIQASAVWFYQVLARRIGHEQMQAWAG